MTRLWVKVETPSGRASFWADQHHILADYDPYSGFGHSLCGRETRGSSFYRTDADIQEMFERDGIVTAKCPTCDRKSGGLVG